MNNFEAQEEPRTNHTPPKFTQISIEDYSNVLLQSKMSSRAFLFISIKNQPYVMFGEYILPLAIAVTVVTITGYFLDSRYDAFRSYAFGINDMIRSFWVNNGLISKELEQSIMLDDMNYAQRYFIRGFPFIMVIIKYLTSVLEEPIKSADLLSDFEEALVKFVNTINIKNMVPLENLQQNGNQMD